MPANSRILLGAMSGTSADGVDVAAAVITGRGLEMKANYLAHVEHAYEAELRRRIFAVRESGQVSMEELAKLGRDITLAYAAATRDLMNQMSLDPRQVTGLAGHGQTLFHAPPDSIQWLDPSLLAAETDLAVISDFRRADLAAGGQGAPLVPFADWILFRHPERTRVILNIGGIANLTYLPAGKGIEDVIAFDTGPGCCILDAICREILGTSFDEEGSLAASAEADLPTLRAFVTASYFDREPPKSTDVPEMQRLWTRRVGMVPGGGALSPAVLLATASAATAVTIGAGLSPHMYPEHVRANPTPHEVIIAGGGTRNKTLVRQIELAVSARAGAWEQPEPEVVRTEAMGLPSQAREAVAFAILGVATLDCEPSNVPSATGARRRVVLGSIAPRPGG